MMQQMGTGGGGGFDPGDAPDSEDSDDEGKLLIKTNVVHLQLEFFFK